MVYDYELFDDRYLIWGRDKDYNLTDQPKGGVSNFRYKRIGK